MGRRSHSRELEKQSNPGKLNLYDLAGNPISTEGDGNAYVFLHPIPILGIYTYTTLLSALKKGLLQQFNINTELDLKKNITPDRLVNTLLKMPNDIRADAFEEQYQMTSGEHLDPVTWNSDWQKSKYCIGDGYVYETETTIGLLNQYKPISPLNARPINTGLVFKHPLMSKLYDQLSRSNQIRLLDSFNEYQLAMPKLYDIRQTRFISRAQKQMNNALSIEVRLVLLLIPFNIIEKLGYYIVLHDPRIHPDDDYGYSFSNLLLFRFFSYYMLKSLAAVIYIGQLCFNFYNGVPFVFLSISALKMAFTAIAAIKENNAYRQRDSEEPRLPELLRMLRMEYLVTSIFISMLDGFAGLYIIKRNLRSLNPFTRHNLLPTLASTGLGLLYSINYAQDQAPLTAIGFGTIKLPLMYLSIQFLIWHLRDNPEVQKQLRLISLMTLLLYYLSYDSEVGIYGSFFTLLTTSMQLLSPEILRYFYKPETAITPEFNNDLAPLQRYGIFRQCSHDVVLVPQEPKYTR